MFKGSISARLALMFVISMVLIVSTIGLLLRSSLHDSLQKQMHNELQFRASLMSPWISARNSPEGWPALASKFTDLTSAEGERVRYWILSDDARFSVGGAPPLAGGAGGFTRIQSGRAGTYDLHRQ